MHNMRSTRQSSVTSMDDDDDVPRRSTRGRNPLPPTSGPLFPPLPPKAPKQAKNSPKSRPSPASKSPSITSRLPTNHNGDLDLKTEVVDHVELDDQLDDQNLRAGSPSKPLALSSVNSLTPPPPTSEDPANGDEEIGEGDQVMDGDEPDVQQSNKDTGPTDGESDVWETYRRQRRAGVRGFGGSANGGQEVTQGDNVEVVEMDEEETPRKKRTSARKSSQVKDDPPEPASASDAGGSSSRGAARRRRGEEQILMDDHLLPAELKRSGGLTGRRGQAQSVKPESQAEEAGEESRGGDGEEEDAGAVEAGEDADVDEEALADDDYKEDVTRCICKRDDLDVMMIQCDSCNVWQHGPCMGIWGDEEAPDEYFCEECRPDLHGPLRKWVKSKDSGSSWMYIPPTPSDLERYHSYHDRYPPSQSTMWPTRHPNSPAGKPSSRSHHRRNTGSPVDDKRLRGARPTVVPPKTEIKQTARRQSRDDGRRNPMGHARRVSHGAARSPSPVDSPSPGNSNAPTKRRVTMNSRDAAYEEEQFKAVLEASRKELLDKQSKRPEEDDTESVATERPLASRKGKRKQEDDEASVDANGSGSSKPKHPNQYTYRPKPAMAPAERPPVHRHTPTPALPPPAQHDHGTRRAGAIANGIIPPPPNAVSVHNLHWHLPDHLSLFSDLLPNPKPIALESRAPRTMTYQSKNFYYNQKYGPFHRDQRDESGNLILPEDLPPREPAGGPLTQLEPPARVRYPPRRITAAEIKKRVRNVFEYVSRIQVEEGKRKDRAKRIGIPDSSTLAPAQRVDKDGDAVMNGEAGAQESLTYSTGLASTELMDGLMRDLITFQETFANGGFATPLIPSSSVPVTPALAQGEEGTLETPNGMGIAEADSGEVEQSPAVDVKLEADPGAVLASEVPIDSVDIKMSEEGKIEDASETVEVYRQGTVGKVIADAQEAQVAKDVEEAVNGVEVESVS
ncbi:hypothetical protein BD324DRAFT_625760 [Kockovaella imperatae]|uniref:Zinc finger PHD-type domain-containing protein n=1 Tax=Kockovaella imperatae TaxID=4999 RepID=A0A1Y1UH10_9TREE|nr:hypothetical protein BD324DRAFT_625760 [Kockovaella imperatae]ORX37343.1 hypothetical protein BD324DRAFT_625760 [Kockovaella imperatae]